MGGRGQFTNKKEVKSLNWYTIKEIKTNNIIAKILDSNTMHKLPEESKTPNRIYIRLDKNNKVYQLRIYENHLPIYDIDFKHFHKDIENPHGHKMKNGERITIGKDNKNKPIYQTEHLNDKYIKLLKDLGINKDGKIF